MTMSHPVNIYEAKAQLSRLIDRALAGEDVVIARAGSPKVRLTPIAISSGPRTAGSARGQIRIGDDFEDLPTAITQGFAGELP